MPEQAQEPLTPIDAQVSATFQPAPWAPPGTPPISATGHDTLDYLGQHAWAKWIVFPDPNPAGLSAYVTVTIDWPNLTTYLGVNAYPSDWDHYTADDTTLILGPCDATSPWDTTPQAWTGNQGYASGTVRAYRPVSTLLPLITMFVSSPTVHGQIDGRIIEHKPTYPEGAIPGETPPDGHIVLLRRRPDAVYYGDEGHQRRQNAFQSAATQWAALSTAQKTAWNLAAVTLRPPLSGWQAWLQTILKRRTDRIPTLEARTGQTLARPTLPT